MEGDRRNLQGLAKGMIWYGLSTFSKWFSLVDYLLCGLRLESGVMSIGQLCLQHK